MHSFTSDVSTCQDRLYAQRRGVQFAQICAAGIIADHTRRTFLASHVGQIMAADFFVVPTSTAVSGLSW
jgi:hypothetical protein